MGLLGLPLGGSSLKGLGEGSSTSTPTSSSQESNTTNFHHHLIAISAGTKHLCALTSDGNIIAMGSNRYGQVGQPVMATAAPSFGDQNDERKVNGNSSPLVSSESEQLPYFYDLGFEDARRLMATSHQTNSQRSTNDMIPTHVVSGCNYNIFYRPGTTNVIAFGNNVMGQLGLGHKQQCLDVEGFVEWDRTVPWASIEDAKSGIKEVVCGQMHTMIIFNSGAVYACGSNMCGELGLDDTNIDGTPRLVRTEGVIVKKDKPGTQIKQVACGMNFTLFLTQEGRVFATGSNNSCQIPTLCKVPEPYPIHRGQFSLSKAALATTSSSIAPHSSEAFAAAPLGATATVAAPLVRIKHIAATSEMAVFVTVKNEVITRGAISEIGFSSGSRFHVVLPLEEDRCTNGRSLPHVHPEIVRVVARETNVLVVYSDGRVVGFGCNTDGQVKISKLDCADPRKADEKSHQSINLASGKFMDEVALVLPKPAASASSVVPTDKLHLCIGLSFGCALDTSPECLYEDGLVDYYRAERERRRAMGEITEKVLMSELVFPPIPKRFGEPDLDMPNTGGTYRRATRGAREAATTVNRTSGTSTKSASDSTTTTSLTNETVENPLSIPGSGSGKTSLDELVKRRRAKLKF